MVEVEERLSVLFSLVQAASNVLRGTTKVTILMVSDIFQLVPNPDLVRKHLFHVGCFGATHFCPSHCKVSGSLLLPPHPIG